MIKETTVDECFMLSNVQRGIIIYVMISRLINHDVLTIMFLYAINVFILLYLQHYLEY